MESQPGIAGVLVHPLKLVRNERGGLMEVQRNDEAHYPGFGQAYVTFTHPGIVKAWYCHRRQVDQLVPVAGTTRLALYDGRPDSPTHGALAEVSLAVEAPCLVRIPTGVWHGFQALGDGPAVLLHLNTVPYIHDAPDEVRLPADDPSIPYHWEAPCLSARTSR